jgi:hypothetical protein
MIVAGVGLGRYNSNMGSSSREAIVEAFDALEADFDRALELSFLRADHPGAAGNAAAL